mmetsp:Transcript_37919/g.82456  ORF Transcript_37919/g.82456 Transcript_37919/m.82456 type:complete len:206 (+) Transcript_37919:242-859(+)
MRCNIPFHISVICAFSGNRLWADIIAFIASTSCRARRLNSVSRSGTATSDHSSMHPQLCTSALPWCASMADRAVPASAARVPGRATSASASGEHRCDMWKSARQPHCATVGSAGFRRIPVTTTCRPPPCRRSACTSTLSERETSSWHPRRSTTADSMDDLQLISPSSLRDWMRCRRSGSRSSAGLRDHAMRVNSSSVRATTMLSL